MKRRRFAPDRRNVNECQQELAEEKKISGFVTKSFRRFCLELGSLSCFRIVLQCGRARPLSARPLGGTSRQPAVASAVNQADWNSESVRPFHESAGRTSIREPPGRRLDRLAEHPVRPALRFDRNSVSAKK